MIYEVKTFHDMSGTGNKSIKVFTATADKDKNPDLYYLPTKVPSPYGLMDVQVEIENCTSLQDAFSKYDQTQEKFKKDMQKSMNDERQKLVIANSMPDSPKGPKLELAR